jgi:DNA repair exonuclease SbcCD ATPase subunit
MLDKDKTRAELIAELMSLRQRVHHLEALVDGRSLEAVSYFQELEEANSHLREEIEQRKRAEEERENLIAELKKALSKVKVLSGLVPICANCKKIRDDSGYWHQLERYISDHSEAEFSHGLCPDCIKILYPELNLDDIE